MLVTVYIGEANLKKQCWYGAISGAAISTSSFTFVWFEMLQNLQMHLHRLLQAQ
jgi:hypothetical protein